MTLEVSHRTIAGGSIVAMPPWSSNRLAIGQLSFAV
jgi:hypothetical protein